MTVLITRPVASGRLLAERLTGMGYHTILEPLLAIEPVTKPPPELSRFAGLLFTSSNAITMLPDAARLEAKAIPCFCVGDNTAASARAAGFKMVYSAQGAGDDLARLIKQHYPAPETSLLHICGIDTDPTVQSSLLAARYQLATWAVYRAVPRASFSSELCNTLQQQRIKAVLLFSPRTAQTFIAMCTTCTAPLANILAVALSPAVAAALTPWPGQTVTAEEPTEAALIACLMRHYPALSQDD